jgi:UDP-N-acetylmuramoyl-tripeptide--D-alanyl-D-alanine ligase
VWINVGDAHIGYFGSREEVAKAKAEILEFADRDTIAVANADDPLVAAHTRGFTGRLVTFGTQVGAHVRAVDIQDRGFDGTSAAVETPRGSLHLKLNLPGRAHLLNVLAGIAVALEYGIEDAAIERTVSAARPVSRRGSVKTLASGARVVDDTYNASPAAVGVMLQALAATPGATRRVAILGEMLELGDKSLALHESSGQAAAAAGVDLLIAVGGPAADGLVSGAIAAGMASDRVLRFASSAEASSRIPSLVQSGDLVLVKGSRGTRMDVISDALAAAEGQG